ncbi:MAG: SIMPL domain-containing protein [Bacillota bacterium]|nr:SIMPL domain-containing protein [Bacillota bacterium]
MKTNNKISVLAIALIVVSAVILGGMQMSGAQVPSNEMASKRILSVEGEAAIQVKPDQATLVIGVRTEKINSKEAQEENTKKMNAVIDALKKAGVADKEIQTSNYNMYATRDYRNGEQGVQYYVVQHSVEVRAKKLDLVGTLIDVSGAAGANEFQGVQFSLENSEEVYNQALAKAYQAAQKKANVLATAMNVKIGMPMAVTEGSGFASPILYRNDMKMSMAADSTTIESGELTIRASVSVQYDY